MHSFNVTAPNWNEIAQAEVTASPTLNESNQVLIETSVGQLLISPLDRGVRMSSKDGWVNIMYQGLDAVGLDQQVRKRRGKSLRLSKLVECHHHHLWLH